MVKILVTDDAGFFRTRMEKLLSEYNIETVVAKDGEEAILIYEKEKPDMVFMDISMPTLDGLVATEKILKEDPEAKICMLTAMGQQSMIKNALNLGAKDFLVKPFNKERLISSIEKILDITLIKVTDS